MHVRGIEFGKMLLQCYMAVSRFLTTHFYESEQSRRSVFQMLLLRKDRA